METRREKKMKEGIGGLDKERIGGSKEEKGERKKMKESIGDMDGDKTEEVRKGGEKKNERGDRRLG